MNVAVIIPTKTLSNLTRCVRAVRQHEPQARIVVVDDSGIPDIARYCGMANLDWVKGQKPFIYARAINSGIREEPDFDGYILLNDDALLETPGGFSALAKAAAEHPEYGLIAPRIHSPICAESDPSQPVNEFGLRDEPRMVVFAAVYIPRHTVDTVGLLDESFTEYGCDDDDYCLRVRKAGLKIGVLDAVRVDHSKLPSTFRPHGGPGNFAHNREIFIKKHGHGLYGPDDTGVRATGLFIATPCYGAMTHVAYTASLLATKDVLRDAGIDHTIKLLPGDSLVPRARGVLTAQFMASGCDRLLFIDGDLWWKPESILRLLRATEFSDIRVACGIYPRKQIPARFPVNFVIDEDRLLTRHNETGYIEVKDAPTGFLMIRRDVIQEMMDAYPERKCTFREDAPPEEERWEYDLYPTPIDTDQRYLSEDFGFSRLWQKLGGRIWADPAIKLAHYGQWRFEGDIASIFEREPEAECVGAK